MPTPPKFKCTLGPLTLSVREIAPKRLDVRVVRRATASLFQHALTIRPGTVLRLAAKGKPPLFVRAKVFVPRVHYGRLVAGGEVEIF